MNPVALINQGQRFLVQVNVPRLHGFACNKSVAVSARMPGNLEATAAFGFAEVPGTISDPGVRQAIPVDEIPSEILSYSSQQLREILDRRIAMNPGLICFLQSGGKDRFRMVKAICFPVNHLAGGFLSASLF